MIDARYLDHIRKTCGNEVMLEFIKWHIEMEKIAPIETDTQKGSFIKKIINKLK